MTTRTSAYRELGDRALLDAAKRLAVDERRATAALLRALIEVDTRRLYLGEGCASMFAWSTQVLHLSEGGAYNPAAPAPDATSREPAATEPFWKRDRRQWTHTSGASATGRRRAPSRSHQSSFASR